MKNGIILAAVMAALCASGETVKTATQPWVRSYVATNRTDVSGKADATNVYTKAEADAKIVELSPPADLTDATNYTDRALSSFAATGTVARARSYGTAERWTDAQGRVWEIGTELSAWSFSDGLDRSVVYGGFNEDLGWPVYGSDVRGADSSDVYWFRTQAEALNAVRFVYIREDGTEVTATRTEYEVTNLVGRVALTNDIPATLPESDPTVPSWAKAGTKPSYSWNEITGKPQVVDETGAAAIAETVVREKSLGGIWDQELGVWWTPKMRNGALTYEATTNVNLNAGN